MACYLVTYFNVLLFLEMDSSQLYILVKCNKKPHDLGVSITVLFEILSFVV